MSESPTKRRKSVRTHRETPPVYADSNTEKYKGIQAVKDWMGGKFKTQGQAIKHWGLCSRTTFFYYLKVLKAAGLQKVGTVLYWVSCTSISLIP